MRLFLAILLVSAAHSSALSAQDPGAESAVRVLDSLWAQSYAQHDTARALQTMAPDIVITSSSGARKDRATELADVRSTPGLTVHYFRSTNVQMRSRNAVVAVAGTLEWEMTWQGARSKTRRRYTATYVPGGPLGWQMIALHIGPAND